MKTFYKTALVLLITLSFSINTVSAQAKENKITATYEGMNDDDYYKFVDAKNVQHLFYDMDDTIEISLYDDDYIGKKFTITWVLKEIEAIDDEGELTGETITVKSIISIKELD